MAQSRFFTPPVGRSRTITHRLRVPRARAVLIRTLAGLLIDRMYPLDDIVDAYRYVEAGRKVGNVVTTVADSA